MSVTPLGPKEATRKIPDFVIEAVNQLIEENCADRFTIRLEDVKSRIRSLTDQQIDLKWLDFEPLYRSQGWKVEYDSPDYTENYKPFFTFTKPK